MSEFETTRTGSPSRQDAERHVASATEPSFKSEEHSPETDWVLQDLVDLVNSMKGASGETLPGLFPIVLFCDGSVIRGRLISNRRFAEEYAKSLGAFVGAIDKPTGDKVEQGWRRVAEELGRRQESEAHDPPQFIHLENPQFISGSSLPMVSGSMVWRGRISEITGWLLGFLGAETR